MPDLRYTVKVSGEAARKTLPVAVRRIYPDRGTDFCAIDIAVHHLFGKRAFWTPADLTKTTSRDGKSITIRAMIWTRAMLNKKPIDDAIGVHAITARIES